MLINFALDVVGTKITSDKVSTDGHECSNLLSTNWHLRRKGFMAEYFIKPPVNLTFEFPCHVCIHHVFVTPCVGQQMSSYLELYSASKFMHRRANHFQPPASTDGCKLPNQQGIQQSSPCGFYPLSKMSVSSSDPICFYNPRVSDLSSSNTAYSSAPRQRVEMRHFRQELISASSHLILRIARTVSGSTAAVSSIDIWGLPTMSVPTAIKDDIINKYTRFINQSVAEKDTKTLNHDTNVQCSTTLANNCVIEGQSLEIPDDFLDPITCEVMAIPMLLPSGKSVDLSTLDHYFNVEASYGRQPRDPFTGLQFSSTIKPIPNGALKTRIDKFLMEHCEDAATSSVARTVRAGTCTSILGKRKNSINENDGVSLLISQGFGRKHFNAANHDQAKVSISEGSQLQTHGSHQSQPMSQPTSLGNRSHQSQPISQPTSLGNGSHQSQPISQPTSLGNGSYQEQPVCQPTNLGNGSHQSQPMSHSTNLGNNKKDPHKELPDSSPRSFLVACSNKSTKNAYSDHSHETQLTSSLNDALSSILHHLPSYSSSSQSSADFHLCSSCKRALEVDKASYVTPCDHLICRECLISDSTNPSMICGACGLSFTRNHVLRRHQII